MSHFAQTYIRGVVHDIAIMLQTTATEEDLKAIQKRIDVHLNNLKNGPQFTAVTEPMISIDLPDSKTESEFDILDDIDTEDEGSIISDYFDDDDILDILK